MTKSPKNPTAAKLQTAATAVNLADERALQSAVEKLNAGQQPARRELDVLKRWQKQSEAAIRERILRTIPQRIYTELSGRHRRGLREIENQWAIPLAGKQVNLFLVIRALHDALAKGKPGKAKDDNHATALAEYRQWASEEKKIAVQKSRRELVPIEEVNRFSTYVIGSTKRYWEQLVIAVAIEVGLWMHDPTFMVLDFDKRKLKILNWSREKFYQLGQINYETVRAEIDKMMNE